MSRRLVLAHRAHQTVVADCLQSAGTESGGVLSGRLLADNYVIPFSIPAGPRAKRTAVRFSPDSGWQQVFLDYLHDRFGIDYVGDWHRHPGLYDEPSPYDLRTARHIVTDPGWNKVEALFPIAVIDKGTVRLRAYLMTRATLQFEEISIEIVSDSDPRMTAVLTGRDANKKECVHVAAGTVPSRGVRRRVAARRFVRRLAAGLWRLSRV